MLYNCEDKETFPTSFITQEHRNRYATHSEEEIKAIGEELETLMGFHMMATMDPIDTSEEGTWLVTNRGWECMEKAWKKWAIDYEHNEDAVDLPLDINADPRHFEYQGIKGYYKGWAIHIGVAPKYGVTYFHWHK